MESSFKNRVTAMAEIVDQFSPVEWTLITEIPVRVVASAITVEESSSLGSLLEQVTGLTQLSNGALKRPESQLVQAVFAAYKYDGEGESEALELSEQWIDNLMPETILRAKQVSDVLAERVSPDEALAFKDWILETAEAICAASKTGGFLGIGGERITEKEQAFLDDLASAFGIVQQ
jgi:hypothetical protein